MHIRRFCVVNLCVQVVAAETLCRDTQATTARRMQSEITIDVARQFPKVDMSRRTYTRICCHPAALVRLGTCS